MFFSLNAELAFNVLELSEDNSFLFNSIETIGENEPLKTLFYGKFDKGKTEIVSASFYPEHTEYNKVSNELIIQNRIGLYTYNLLDNSIKPIKNYPTFVNGNEYLITPITKIALSPNSRYLLSAIPSGPSTCDIFLYDKENMKYSKLIESADRLSGDYIAKWDGQSDYFLYQKKSQIYYFSIKQFKSSKLLSEEWRFVAPVNLKNVYFSGSDTFIWIENKIIYRADVNQLYYRSIYKSYLRQGDIIGKIPFDFSPDFDHFVFSNGSNRMLLIKDGKSILNYEISGDIVTNPYIQLNDNMRFDKADLLNDGTGILMVKVLKNGEINKKIFLLRKKNNEFYLEAFDNAAIKESKIYNYSFDRNFKNFMVTSDKGAFLFDFDDGKLLFSYTEQAVLHAHHISGERWILNGKEITCLVGSSGVTPIIASTVDDSFFDSGSVLININDKQYILNNEKFVISELVSKKTSNKVTENDNYRILSRQLNKGFYKEQVLLKELYSGKQFAVTDLPKLYYELFQPEIKMDYTYYNKPLPEKYETSLIFDCIETSEGIFPILTSLDKFKIDATFFINGTFMDINPLITKEISNFSFEIGNLFLYYVNLTNHKFMVNQDFIRQGLSSNEEKFYQLTNKNFAPFWHSPNYAYNETIIKYGLKSGYKYVTYQLDTLDWVDKNSRELSSNYYMNNTDLIRRVLKRLKPGQIIVMNTGKNNAQRDEWLFNDLDILISEMVRAGYSFTTASDILNKYRE